MLNRPYPIPPTPSLTGPYPPSAEKPLKKHAQPADKITEENSGQVEENCRGNPPWLPILRAATPGCPNNILFGSGLAGNPCSSGEKHGSEKDSHR
jgi:hypothetical protein